MTPQLPSHRNGVLPPKKRRPRPSSITNHDGDDDESSSPRKARRFQHDSQDSSADGNAQNDNLHSSREMATTASIAPSSAAFLGSFKDRTDGEMIGGEGVLYAVAVAVSAAADNNTDSQTVLAQACLPGQHPENESSKTSTAVDPVSSFRPHQLDQWETAFQELQQYRAKHGHTLVPHELVTNRKLAKWVKRQRYQYKLLQNGQRSTMTSSRKERLDELGFVWEAQNALWLERLHALQQYHRQHGNCMVPSNYPPDPQLSVWVKYQRRQLKRLRTGKQSTMTQDRLEALNRLNFEWNPRNLSLSSSSSTTAASLEEEEESMGRNSGGTSS